MRTEDGDFSAQADGKVGVEKLTEVWIEREKTKRLLMGIAAVLFVVASLVIVFGPADREKVTFILGAVLIVVSLGAIGAVKFKIKVPFISVDTSVAEKGTISSVRNTSSDSIMTNAKPSQHTMGKESDHRS